MQNWRESLGELARVQRIGAILDLLNLWQILFQNDGREDRKLRLTAPSSFL